MLSSTICRSFIHSLSSLLIHSNPLSQPLTHIISYTHYNLLFSRSHIHL
jgi:hypothetical protein